MKKSTILRGMFICISFAFAILAYELNAKYNLNEIAIKTNSTPITNKTIVLDAGHRISLTKEQLDLQVQLSKL